MKKTSRLVWIAVMTGIAGCSGGAPAADDSVQVSETSTTLDISAFRDGKLAAHLLLERGVFEIPDREPGYVAEGRRLSVAAEDLKVEHVSEGASLLVLPITARLSSLEPLLTTPAVRDPLARWGVTFSVANGATQHETSGETPYDVCAYAPNPACGSTACYQHDSGGVTYEDLCCASQQARADRTCNGVWPGSSACGTNGTNGCANCWSEDLSGWNYWCQSSGADGSFLVFCAQTGMLCSSNNDCCSGGCDRGSRTCN